jgi:hypothetical protein
VRNFWRTGLISELLRPKNKHPNPFKKSPNEKILLCFNRTRLLRRYLFNQLYLSVMEAKHTPGPWRVCVGNAGSIFGDLNNDAHNGDNPYIGEVAGIGVDKDIPECTANAHLIESAPDMFEVIKYLYDWAHANQVFGPIYPKLEAAYLKAAGQHSPVTNQ